MVTGGMIQKVIFPPDGDISIHLEEETGQAFVYALTPNPSDTTITIVTGDGLVQDVELHFADQSSEVIVLDEIKEIPVKQEPCVHPQYSQDIVCILKSIMQGKVPSGYRSYEYDQQARKVDKNIMAGLIARFVGPSDVLYVWSVWNCSTEERCIKEKEVNFQNGAWVYIQQNKLRPREKMLAIVSVRRA
jgi:hypothetical protein